MKTLGVATMLALALAGGLRAEEAKPAASGKTPMVQMAILLDTSNSMDGLINQARAQLWGIVNEFQRAKLGGKQPVLNVALYEYGNNNIPGTEGFVRMVLPLTGDLDKVSEALFALTTNGGDEFCGQVIDRAVRQLDWSQRPGDLKCIFIAGNEPFSQGMVDYHQSCKQAAAKGITVSTIFCGDRQEGIATGWEDGAKLADGTYLCINQDAAPTITTPQDDQLARLSTQLSATYLPYGPPEKRDEAAKRQSAQDANAAQAAAGAAAGRADFKASRLYRNSGWDLVDALDEGVVKLEDLKQEELPAAMQAMTLAEMKKYVAEQAKTRKDLQTQIRALSDARREYVATEQARMQAEAAAAPAPALSDAVQEALEMQAPAAGLEFEK